MNSRRVAERLAAALNELAGELLVQAHHGSHRAPAAPRDRGRRSRRAGCAALVATSSLELGIDMGAIDLVVQIEAPPSVASGLQRIGRAGHQVGAPSRGVIFPKYRGDLVACAALTRGHARRATSRRRATRATRSTCSPSRSWRWSRSTTGRSTRCFEVVRGAAPFAELPRARPRGRARHALRPLSLGGARRAPAARHLGPAWRACSGRAEGARRVAVVNGGTIPDRGLYGVFLAGGKKGQRAVGELDEEMVLESRVGETFLLGASSWRIEEITHDRVLVSPAPGEPGKMPFWHGDAAARPLELGPAHRRGSCASCAPRRAPRRCERLVRAHGLDRRAAREPAPLPRRPGAGDRRGAGRPDVVVERSPRRAGRLAGLPALAAREPGARALVHGRRRRAREQLGLDAETLWTNDGFALRLPGHRRAARRPRSSSRSRRRSRRSWSSSSARPRSSRPSSARPPPARCSCRAAAPGSATPLWQQRKRAADLLARRRAVPARSRCCSRPTASACGTSSTCPRWSSSCATSARGAIRVGHGRHPRALAVRRLAPVRLRRELHLRRRRAARRAPRAGARHRPGPAPGAARRGGAARAPRRRRARRPRGRSCSTWRRSCAPGAPTASPTCCSASAISPREELARAQRHARGRREPRRARRASGARSRCRSPASSGSSRSRTRRATATRSASRSPHGLPEALLAPVPRRARRARRCATPAATRRSPPASSRRGFGARARAAERALERLPRARPAPRGRLPAAAAPSASGAIRRCSRAAAPPLAGAAPRGDRAGRAARARRGCCSRWHGIPRRGRGLDAVLDAVERLQGAPLPGLAARDGDPAGARRGLPAAATSTRSRPRGEVLWIGLEPLGERDGRIALYLADALPRLLPPARRRGAERARPSARGRDPRAPAPGAARRSSRTSTRRRAAATRSRRSTRSGPGLARARHQRHLPGAPRLHAGRASGAARARGPRAARRRRPAFRSRLAAPPAAGGRWTLVEARRARPARARRRRSGAPRLAQQLLVRYGVVTRGVAAAESLPGGFGAGLRRAPPPRGERADPPRLLRGGGRRDAVRAARRARPAPRLARAARGAGGGDARRDRSGEPVGRAARVAAAGRARRRGSARRARSARGWCSWTASSPRGSPRGAPPAPRLAAGVRAGALARGRRGGRGAGRPRRRGARARARACWSRR